MFEIKYCFASNQPKVSKNVDETALRYNLFLGSLLLEKDDRQLSMNWEWIPLLDFALCLHAICDQLNEQPEGEDVFEFTESDATIIFRRNKDKCTVSLSFSDVYLTMDYAEFQNSVQLFCKQVTADILAKNKKLKENDVFRKVAGNFLK